MNCLIAYLLFISFKWKGSNKIYRMLTLRIPLKTRSSSNRSDSSFYSRSSTKPGSTALLPFSSSPSPTNMH